MLGRLRATAPVRGFFFSHRRHYNSLELKQEGEESLREHRDTGRVESWMEILVNMRGSQEKVCLGWRELAFSTNLLPSDLEQAQGFCRSQMGRVLVSMRR